MRRGMCLRVDRMKTRFTVLLTSPPALVPVSVRNTEYIAWACSTWRRVQYYSVSNIMFPFLNFKKLHKTGISDTDRSQRAFTLIFYD